MIEKAPEFKLESGTDAWHALLLKRIGDAIKNDDFKKIEKGYLYWDKIKYLNQEVNPELLWSSVKTKRLVNSKPLLIGNKNLFGMSMSTNKYLEQNLHYLDFNFGAGLQKEQLLSELEKQQYLNNALMEEAVFSSMIEGATTTRVKAKDMLRKNRKPKNNSEQMILNNYNTIQYISEHKEETISIEKLFEIHKLVAENTLEEENVGVFRNSNDIKVVNAITGETVHTPPDFLALNELIKSFCDFFNNNAKEDFIHPIVKASILHFLIGYIHPFVDGNGRTTRAIFYWYLLKNGYWLTEYLSISRVIMKTKTQYEKAYIYTEIDDMDVTYFIHYQVKILMKAFEDLKDYVANKKKDESKLLKYLQAEKINERQAEILYKLEKKPKKYFTVKEIENTYGVTNQTARTDLEELVDRGYLKKVAKNKKTYNYWKGDKYDLEFGN